MDMKANHENYAGKCIEITQDAAGFCLYDGNITGIFTQDIESCVVIIVNYELGFLMIHDSGQLEIQCVIELVKNYGRIIKVEAIYGTSVDPGLRNLQKNRIKKIFKTFNTNIEPSLIDQEKFGLLKELKKGVLILPPGKKPSNLLSLPNQELRNDIIKFNNFFIKPNSQSLIVDLQFDGYEYSENTTIIHNVKYVLRTIYEQHEHFINNLNVTLPILDANILPFPQWFKDFIAYVHETHRHINVHIIMQKYQSLYRQYEH